MHNNKLTARRSSSPASSISSVSSWETSSHDSDNDNDNEPSTTSSRRSSLRFFTYARRHGSPSPANTSARECRSCGGMTVKDTRALWRCMLQLQQRFGCYNSTRIDLAVNAGDAGFDLMPNPFIIDTLNDSLVDLPAEGWDMLDRCLVTGTPPRETPPRPKSSKPRRNFWAHS